MSNLPLPPLGSAEGEALASLLEQLAIQGYAVVRDLVPLELVDRLFLELKSLTQAEFKRAGVGRQQDFQVNRFVRSDHICWLNGETPASSAFLAWIETLRQELNRRLLLGLFDYECHYARYPKGAFYKTHRDAFKGQANRVLSTVLYLNPQWTPSDGGELELFDDSGEQRLASIAPEYGKLVVFLSEEFPHQVLPARRERYSLAGWFRLRNL
mgnify:CR=1 FL=1